MAWIAAVSVAACSDSAGQDPSAADGGSSNGGASGDASPARDGQVAGDATEAACESGDLTPLPPTVELLVNQSGTMTFELEGESRWDGVRAVLSPEFLAEFDSQARLGATLFSSEKGYEGGECPLLERTPPALSNSASIVQLMVDNEPIDDTPTAETIQIVAQDLVELRQSEPELHPAPAIVFVTDGTPDTCDQPEPNEGEAEAVAAAQAAYEAGVPTFIIGLSEEAEGPYFQQMANVGAGLSATFGNAEFFFAVDRTSLRDAYEAALLRTRSCRYSLEGQGTNALQVSLDGEQLDPDAEWQLVDSTTIQLLGPACATVRRTKTYDLEASCDDPR